MPRPRPAPAIRRSSPAMRPARTGIIANDWIDQKAPRADKTVYCAEDESVPGSDLDQLHRVRQAPEGADARRADEGRRPAHPRRLGRGQGSRRGDDGRAQGRRALVVGRQGLHVSYAGPRRPAVVTRANAAIAGADRRAAAGARRCPPICAARDQPIAIGGGKTVGTGHFERAAGDAERVPRVARSSTARSSRSPRRWSRT